MPELPEVETMVRQIRPHVAGRKILSLRACRTKCRPISITPGLKTIAARVKDHTVAAVRRLGKRVVLDLTDESNLVIEPRMTGLMLLTDPPDVHHLRLEWLLDGSGEYSRLWFWDQRGLGTLRWYQPGELASALGSHRLGPDALALTVDDYRRVCGSTARPIKVALLDQKLIAGIGNLYASEILHLAKIHPEAPAKSLTVRQLQRLLAATQEILEIAIRYEGSTLGDGTYRNALNKAGGYQNAHRVYDRENQSCPTCNKSVIIRIVQAQRSTFYCVRCQK
ncbi:MAG TPA: bifunctional DNA-formamidopyrimidine glycosylase/DNA-(apurinic or apyrimidinic site) lyase [Planctomycetaceae bacterium]|jgi:formamidopyrimidine-DNA glycosylase|nr:bifunctional DNA-formamidopyrimidine glycosylase/DNA-(apurinic or apyrimidinic site) lyase [Planctomycetaceae bacterium]